MLSFSIGNNDLIDVNGNVTPFVKWGEKQPNGENFQQCVSVWRKAKPFFDDVRCNKEHCFLCKKSNNKLYYLRGKIPINIERKYFTVFLNFIKCPGYLLNDSGAGVITV